MSGDDEFRVVRTSELREQGFTAANRPAVDFAAADVPGGLRYLIPLAMQWGINDDLIREDVVATASEEARAELRDTVANAEDELDEWLAGPEAASPSPTDAYLAFTAMRMAADEA